MKLTKSFLINNIFTEYDESLTKNINTDPLGFQIVWTYFGQKIFHNKTTSIALDIRSYTINLFNHYIIYQIIQENKNLSFKSLITNEISLKEKIEKTLIILENLLTWSWFSTRDDWTEEYKSGLLGTYKALSIWEDEQTYLINFNERDFNKIEILKNQRSLGVSGRYKGPFRAMGFFKEYDESSYKGSSELFENEIKELIESQNSPLKNLYKEVISFLQKAQELKVIEIGKNNTLVNKYVESFKNPKDISLHTKHFWKKYLGLNQDEASIVYKHIDLDKIEQNTKQIFTKALEESFDNKIFQDINQIEPQLTYINLLFDYLIVKSGNKISELNNDYILQLENFEWNNLSINTNTSIFLRVEELKKIKDYKTLLEYHKIVMNKRSQMPWIELKNDEILKTNIAKNIASNKSEELLSKGLNNDWLNDYYIYSIRNIKRGLEI